MISPVLHLKQAGRLDRFFIDGEWTLPSTISETARTAVICPSTEETLSRRFAEKNVVRASE